MKPDKQKLRHDTRERISEEQEQQQQHSGVRQQGIEFESVEEMLRHDAAATEPSARIEKRLKASLAREPRAANSPWWRSLFGK